MRLTLTSMASMRSRLPGWLLTLCWAVASPHAGAASIESGETAPSPQAGHAYRFVLRDPQSLSEPHRKGPYKILLQGGATTEDGARVVRGTTDDTGRTAWLRTQQPLEEGQWQVSPVVGRGDHHTSFTFVGKGGGQPLSDLPYMVDMQHEGLYCGYADEQGATAEITTPVPMTLTVAYATSFDECLRLRRAVGQALKLRSASAAARTLDALAERQWGSEVAELLHAKARSEVLRRGSRADVRALVNRQIQGISGSDPKEPANVLNDIGYDLIEQRPPRHLSLAHRYLKQAAALSPDDPDVMDSLGWSLHLMKREDEALARIDASIAAYARACDPDVLTNRQITYSHRASILWSLGRRDEALDHWALAHKAGPDREWATGLDAERVNQDIARRAEGLPATDLCQAPAGAEPSQARRP